MVRTIFRARVLLVAVLTVGGLAGCATTSSVDEERQPVDYQGRAEALPIGEATLGVASMHPERVDALVARDRETLGEWIDLAGSPAGEYLASRAIAGLFQSWQRMTSVVDDAVPDFRFEHLDRSRTMYLALTARGHRQALRDLAVGKPRPAEASPAGGRLLRLVVPANDPEALVEEFETHCSGETDAWMGGACDAVVRFAAVDRYAVADLYFGPEEASRREAVVSALPSDPGAPSGYFERLTPAARAFVGRRSAVGVYAQTADLWKIGAVGQLAGATTGEGENDTGARELSARLRAETGGVPGVYGQLARQAALAAPATREYEDVAVLHGDDGGPVVDAIRTYTARGHRIAEAGRIETELPRLALGDPMLTVEWAFDAPAALRAASVPEELSREMNRVGHSRPGSILRRYSPLARLVPPVAYPVSTAKWASTMSFGRGPSRADALTRLRGVRALRAGLDVAPSEDSPLGVEFSGAAVAEVTRASNLDATVETAVALGRRAGLPVRMATDYQGEFIRLKVTINASMSLFGDPTPVEPGRIAHLDLEKLAAQFAGEDPPVGPEVEVPEEPERAQAFAVEQASNASGRGLRLRLGDAAEAPFSMPAADVDLARPSDPPSCARRAVASARRLLANGGTGRELDIGVYTGELPELIRGAEACADQSAWADRIAGVAAAHLRLFGEAKATIGEWAEAERHFGRACDFGADRACERAETAATRAERLRLPAVGHTATLRGALPEAVVALSRAGLRIGDADPLPLDRLEGGADEGPSIISTVEKHVGPTELITTHGRQLVVPVAAEASLPSAHVKRLARRAFEATVDKERPTRHRRVQRPRQTEKTEAIVLFARDPGDQRYRRSGPRYLSIRRERRAGSVAREERFEVAVDVTPGGFEVRTEKGALDPIEGCEDDGPTVCLTGEAPAMEARLSAYRRADEQGADGDAREAAATVAAAYPYHRLYRVLFDVYDEHVDDHSYRTPIHLSIEGALPFEVLAKTMATVARRTWNAESYGSADELFGDGGRSRPMFDVIYLDLDE